MLARLYRAGELSPAWVPDEAHEALRDLVRLREAAVSDRLQARNRLTKFLLRRSLYPPKEVRRWSDKYTQWMSGLRFEHLAWELTFADLIAEVDCTTARVTRLEGAIDQVIEESPAKLREVVQALTTLRGVGKITSTTLLAEVGDFSRFRNPRALMGYAGLIPIQRSSGARIKMGGITKTGNTHIRRVIVESAWIHGRRPATRPPRMGYNNDVSQKVLDISVKAQDRLHRRYWELQKKGKDVRKVAVAVARESLGFIWDIACEIERAHADS